MIPFLLAALIATAPMTDSVDSSALLDAAARRDDSAQLAKLDAVQKAWDEDSVARSAAPDSSARSVGSSIAQIVSSLAVLLGLCGFGFLLVRRLRRGSGTGRGRSGSLLDVLETRPLGQGTHVTLVRVHDRVVAVGHGQGAVSALAEFHGNDAAAILAETGTGAVSVKDFAATLDTFLDRFRSNPTDSGKAEEGGR